MDSDFENPGLGPHLSGPSNCPEPLIWYEIASGELSPELTQRHLQHATDCDACGELLEQAVYDLNEEPSASEARDITELQSAQPGWQRRLARRIVTGITSVPVSAKFPWRTTLRVALATSVVLAVAIAGYRYQFQRDQKKQVGELLAQAASARRFSELRMPGAQQAPLGTGFLREREPTSTFLDTPGELLKAETLIYDQLASHPSDAFWLNAKAKADLLDGEYNAAESTLVRALQLDPHSPEILTDLATANFQQKNYAAAYERLSQVLSLRPNDPVALFNRAVVSESLFLYQQALDDWGHYLKVDPSSPWATEAREKAEKLRANLKLHDQSRASPLLTPAQLVQSRDDPAIRSKVDERIEEYLDRVIRDWLPKAYPESATQTDTAVRPALFFLADLIGREHRDRWLSDLLNGSSSPNFPAAVASLARAVGGNRDGDYTTSVEQAVKAERLFLASGNTAGVLRAQFEQIFANQLTRRSESCRRRAKTALSESSRFSYSWLHIQLELEEGVCSFLMGDIGTDERASATAADLAQKSGYSALHLRAVVFSTADLLSTGDQTGASKSISTALHTFWSGQFQALRGYNLYFYEAEIAQSLNLPNFRMASLREATEFADSSPDALQRAWAHNDLAEAAADAQRPDIAERQYAEAARLFALAPPAEASRNYAIESGIRIARLETRFGRFDDAIVRLTSIQNQIRPLSNNYLAQMFYSTLGELQLARHLDAEAEQALRPAVAFAEQSLATLRSEAERTNWSKDAAPIYLALAEAELEQGRSQEALEMYEWYLGAPQRVASRPSSSRSITNPPMPVLPRLEPRLPLLTNETVLAYAALPDGLAIWVYDNRGVHALWDRRPTGDLRELAARFHDLSSDPRSEMPALRRDARLLYKAFFAPVEQLLAPGRTLVIEADGWIANVPFEALLDAQDHYLIERVPMVHSLGRAAQFHPRNHNYNDTGISAELPALVVASTASSTADGLIALPDVAAEADTVSRGFHSATVLKGPEATYQMVVDKLPGAAVFHFAGHSLATPNKSGLFLAADTPTIAPLLLDADALRRVRLPNLQLAFLSACSTAAGSRGSSGFNGVAETLLREGVPHVVASRWAVDSVQARAFVDDFYRNALAGQTVSDAIRLSSRNILSNPHTRHPYYWAAFAAYGRP